MEPREVETQIKSLRDDINDLLKRIDVLEKKAKIKP